MTTRSSLLDRPAPRILTVYAHPDDESFGASAIVAQEVQRGATLAGLWATRGEHGRAAGEPPPAPAELARLRERDLRTAAAAIGYTAVEILDYEDGTLADLPAGELERHALGAIRRHRPDVVLTFGPGGITGHTDHRAVHRAALAAFRQAQAEGQPLAALYYEAVPPEQAAGMGIAEQPDGQPNVWIDVSATWSVRLDALRVHARHVADARDCLAELERDNGDSSRKLAPLHRATL